MSQVTEEEAKKQRDIYHHALRGDVVEVGGMDIAHNNEENSPHSEQSKRKKKEQDAELYRALTEAQQAYNELMDRLNTELRLLRETITELEDKMTTNRIEWDKNLELIKAIDEVIADFEDGGELNREEIGKVFQMANKPVPEQSAAGAEWIVALQEIKNTTYQTIESLDEQFKAYETDHIRFRAREDEVFAIKGELDALDNPTTETINEISQRVGSKTLHAAASLIDNGELADKADAAVKNEWDLKQSETIMQRPTTFGFN